MTFPKGKKVAVSGNVADVLMGSRFARHFEVSERRHHVGPFTAGKQVEEFKDEDYEEK